MTENHRSDDSSYEISSPLPLIRRSVALEKIPQDVGVHIRISVSYSNSWRFTIAHTDTGEFPLQLFSHARAHSEAQRHLQSKANSHMPPLKSPIRSRIRTAIPPPPALAYANASCQESLRICEQTVDAPIRKRSTYSCIPLDFFLFQCSSPIRIASSLTLSYCNLFASNNSSR